MRSDVGFETVSGILSAIALCVCGPASAILYGLSQPAWASLASAVVVAALAALAWQARRHGAHKHVRYAVVYGIIGISMHFAVVLWFTLQRS